MIANFLKITFRALRKNSSYSLLNIFGLAIGITCAGLIFLWVENEVSYDQFLPKKDRLAVIRENQTYQGKVRTFSSTPRPMAAAIVREVPGIAAACRVDFNHELFGVGDKSLYEDGGWVDSSFFGIFQRRFVEGNAQTAFLHPSDIVITETVARQFFGDGAAIGRTIRMNNKKEYKVTGVIEDFPANSTLQLRWLAPMSTAYFTDNNIQTDDWGNNSTTTYVELAPVASVVAVNARLKNYIATKRKDVVGAPQCFLFSAIDWHLRSAFEDGVQAGGEIQYIDLFTVIAWIILLIACINFMNLATARSERRAREVGVRKVLGAGRNGLIGQFIGESIVLSGVAVVIGLVLISLVLPAFNAMTGKTLGLGLAQPAHWAAMVVIAVVCGLVAGSYPALYLSSFNPVYVFKGIRIRGAGASFVRKGLVVTQFTVSITLIISTLMIYLQLQHILNRDLGYDKNNLITMDVRGNMLPHFKEIRQDLLNTGVVENAGLNSFNTISIGDNGAGVGWAGKDPRQEVLLSWRAVTPGFLATAGMHLFEGRDLRSDLPVADSNHVIITEALAKMMGKGSAVGKKLLYSWGGSSTVIGVVKDYVYGDMYGSPDPVVFYYDSASASLMYVRYKEGVRPDAALAAIGGVMKKDNPAYPFEYKFVDEAFNNLFASEKLMGVLSRLFAGLAILISCLGLFGLSAYTAERRKKEIGIRKVLGASVSGITRLLSREFLILVGISALIAFPVAGMAMSRWLEQYHYRISIQWWVFAAAGVAAIGIALITISFQSIKAALMNPVRSLRSE
jgi:putative ABC transport system permease protein